MTKRQVPAESIVIYVEDEDLGLLNVEYPAFDGVKKGAIAFDNVSTAAKLIVKKMEQMQEGIQIIDSGEE